MSIVNARIIYCHNKAVKELEYSIKTDVVITVHLLGRRKPDRSDSAGGLQ